MNMLFMWVIFDSPGDFPGCYVVRRCTILAGQVLPDREVWALAKDLEMGRATIPGEAMVRIARHPEDVRSLVETWL